LTPAHQNDLKNTNRTHFSKKKKFKIWSKAGSTAEPNLTCQERIGLRPTQIAIWLRKINVATILTIN